MSRKFKLYPKEVRWCSFGDYGAILDITARLEARTVVEFGPGSSTLALIEGGATGIVCCEDNPDWFRVYHERLERKFQGVVSMLAYTWSDPLVIPELEGRRFDMALIDGPHGTLNRPAVVEWCVSRADVVVVPTEDVAYGRSALRPHISRIAEAAGRPVEWMDAPGSLAGCYAVLGRPL